MHKQAKITTKGQITIPREVRNALGVRPGDSLVFEQDAGEIRVRRARRESPFAQYRGIGNPGMDSGRASVLREVKKLRGDESREK